MKKVICLVLSLCFIFSCSKDVFAYSSSKAAAYAQKYALSYNPNYLSFAGSGGDCANFASQCLKEGGLKTNKTWKSGSTKSGYTAAWINCEKQKSYLTSNNLGKVVKQYKTVSNAPDATSYMGVGKLVYYDWQDNGSIDHVSVGSMKDTQGRQYVCAHTSNRLNAIWSLRSYLSKEYKNSIRYYIFTIN